MRLGARFCFSQDWSRRKPQRERRTKNGKMFRNHCVINPHHPVPVQHGPSASSGHRLTPDRPNATTSTSEISCPAPGEDFHGQKTQNDR